MANGLQIGNIARYFLTMHVLDYDPVAHPFVPSADQIEREHISAEVLPKPIVANAHAEGIQEEKACVQNVL